MADSVIIFGIVILTTGMYESLGIVLINYRIGMYELYV